MTEKMTPKTALELQSQFVAILKKRFPNLTTEETVKLSGELVITAAAVLES